MNLNKRIQLFYDQSTPIWLDMWGEHMHHGHYGINGDIKKGKTVAQIDMIEELLRWSGSSEVTSILDAGCGVGGSARYLSEKYNAKVLAMTLSPIQVSRGQYYNVQASLQERVQIVERDMMSLDSNDGPFDLIWSMESAEHISDKQGLLDIFYDRLKPGGTLVMATWCHRETPPALLSREARLLQNIYELYHLPPMVSISSLKQMATTSGFQSVKTDDWSTAVAPFWNKVIQSALTWEGIKGLARSGLSTIKGAWAMQYMKRGFSQELIKFGVVTGVKA